eukprot:TRINITY_DN7651_c0_g1_i1.p1 TRINITY_DN7651_c0_g1~~TRINITY_DN7651_c0_g1_i1.p1  ORF type:complete len:210 (+),score=35.01 TRINITY_DN7651_c0_g1_i1:318-947(+)
MISTAVISKVLRVNEEKANEIQIGLAAVASQARVGYQIENTFRSEQVWKQLCEYIPASITVTTLAEAEGAPIFVNRGAFQDPNKALIPEMFSLLGEPTPIEKQSKITQSITQMLRKLSATPPGEIFHIKSTAHRCPLVATLLGYPSTWVCKQNGKLQSADLITVTIPTNVGTHVFSYTVPKDREIINPHPGKGISHERSSVPPDVSIVL